MFKVSDYPINSFVEAYRGELRRKGLDASFQPFTYNADFINLLAASADNQVNTTDADSAFGIFYTMQTTYVNATQAYTPFPNAVVRITDDATGRSLEDRPTHINQIFGRGMRPFTWIRPMVISPKSSWTTNMNNLEVVALDIRIAFSGVKIFTRPLQ